MDFTFSWEDSYPSCAVRYFSVAGTKKSISSRRRVISFFMLNAERILFYIVDSRQMCRRG